MGGPEREGKKDNGKNEMRRREMDPPKFYDRSPPLFAVIKFF